MTNQRILDLIRRLQHVGWSVQIKDPPGIRLNEAVRNRYQIPEQYLLFLALVALCVAPNDQWWFLCEADYNDTSETAFRWNEFELLSRDAADGDLAALEKISIFWDSCLPIFLSVSSGYTYLGIVTQGERMGKVVRGSEPEFEEIEVVAESFFDFLFKLAEGLIDL